MELIAHAIVLTYTILLWFNVIAMRLHGKSARDMLWGLMLAMPMTYATVVL